MARMVVLKRTRSDTEAFPKEEVELVGSTGNIYTVRIQFRDRISNYSILGQGQDLLGS